MADESDLERTEKATPKRLKQARDDGQVPQSRELSAFLLLVTASGLLWLMGPGLARGTAEALRIGLSFGHAEATEPAKALDLIVRVLTEVLGTIAPVAAALMLAAVASPLFMGGIVFTGKPLQPDFGRMSPIKGVGRMFSTHGLIELVKALLKAGVVGWGAWWVVSSQQEAILSLTSAPLTEALGQAGGIISWSLFAVVLGMAAIVAVDVPVQLWQFHSRLKMSREDIRREAKDDEGDPQLKGRIRSLQREAARKRMMQEVPHADVVVTNPTHFAVALKYEPERMRAPRVVAKGSDELARRIRELATEHGVPLLEAPALARALHRHTELNDEIPVRLYTAVAEVLAYVHQLARFQASGGMRPEAPAGIDVPEDMDPLHEQRGADNTTQH